MKIDFNSIKHERIPVEEDYRDLIPMAEWIECVESSGFIDYDGFGEYSDGSYVYKNRF